MAHIQPLLEAVRRRCLDRYNPHLNCSVDEAMVAFRGRLEFLQCMPVKPTTYGVKLWMSRPNERLRKRFSRLQRTHYSPGWRRVGEPSGEGLYGTDRGTSPHRQHGYFLHIAGSLHRPPWEGRLRTWNTENKSPPLTYGTPSIHSAWRTRVAPRSCRKIPWLQRHGATRRLSTYCQQLMTRRHQHYKWSGHGETEQETMCPVPSSSLSATRTWMVSITQISLWLSMLHTIKEIVARLLVFGGPCPGECLHLVPGFATPPA